MNNLKKQYNENITANLMKKLDVDNVLDVPGLEKVVINVGVGKGLKDKEYLNAVEQTLTKITGQKPVATKARKSISNFKIREGNIVGYKVTLRRGRMWDFIEKLIKVTLPRVRDFRGISKKGIDEQGNLSIGFSEYIAFPEIDQDEVKVTHGLEINIKTTAEDFKEGEALF